MHLTRIICVAAAGLIGLTRALREEQQQVFADGRGPPVGPLNVAIIGAGAAGASSAYHLAKFAAASGLPANITVFERNPYIGGRTTTVNAYNDPGLPVELGASIFVEVNRILLDAAKEFNLSLSTWAEDRPSVPGASLAIWDGQTIVHEQSSGSSWWNIARLLWKYGLAPIRTVRLMKKTVAKFLQLYDEPTFPWVSLSQAVADVELLGATTATGEQYMANEGIAGAFGHDIVQASTRVNYAQNLKHIHGLEAMVCMASDGAVAVKGGNWQIFDRMVTESKAKTLLQTAVSSIKRQGNSYQLSYSDVADGSRSAPKAQEFDAVILAAPYQFADISFHTTPEHGVPDEIPYVQLHVTLFTSPSLISPAFVGYPPDKPAPKVILTTLPPGEDAKDGAESCGSPGFFSISLLRPITNPATGGQEYLYKIFSPAPPNSTFLTHLLGLKQPSDHGEGDTTTRDITWIYRKLWHSYPYEYPRITFEPVQLDGALWYTGGMDGFISTMETNALIGKNIARLLVDQLGEKYIGEI